MILAVAPVTVKAAAGSDQIYYVTRQANINNQTMIEPAIQLKQHYKHQFEN